MRPYSRRPAGFFCSTSALPRAAGSLVVILLWAYYSSMILLFGAELTQAWAEQRGSGVAPVKGAVRVNELKKEAQAGQRAPA